MIFTENISKHHWLQVYSLHKLEWRKALQRFIMREESEVHREATQRLVAKASNVHIISQLNTQYATDQQLHKSMLLKVLTAIRFLGRRVYL